MLTRRRVLGMGFAGAAVVGVPLVAAPLISRARASGGLPLNVVNSTGRFANSVIRMYVVGTDPETGAMGYVRESGRSPRPTRRTTARTARPTSGCRWPTPA